MSINHHFNDSSYNTFSPGHNHQQTLASPTQQALPYITLFLSPLPAPHSEHQTSGTQKQVLILGLFLITCTAVLYCRWGATWSPVLSLGYLVHWHTLYIFCFYCKLALWTTKDATSSDSQTSLTNQCKSQISSTKERNPAKMALWPGYLSLLLSNTNWSSLRARRRLLRCFPCWR